MKPHKGKRGKPKKNIPHVQSGIGLSGFDKETGTEQQSFLTSRAARVLLAGAGFLADAYDLFVINLVLRLLKDEYPQYAATGQLTSLEGSVASAALIGSILGQLVAGSMADVFGRKKIFVITAALITIGSFGSAFCVDTPYLTIYGQISCWRFILGTGVGGEYPLAATVTSESSSPGKRGSLMAAVFAMQGFGSLLSGIIVFSCLYFGLSINFTWRFALAFGALPAILAFPWRLRMHETESFERLKKERHELMQLQAEVTASSHTSTGGGYQGQGQSGQSKNPISYEAINHDFDQPSGALFTTSHELAAKGIALHDLPVGNHHNLTAKETDSLLPPTIPTSGGSSPLSPTDMSTNAPSGKLKGSGKGAVEGVAGPGLLWKEGMEGGLGGSNSCDSNDYGQHYIINSRNNSNTDYLSQHQANWGKVGLGNNAKRGYGGIANIQDGTADRKPLLPTIISTNSTLTSNTLPMHTDPSTTATTPSYNNHNNYHTSNQISPMSAGNTALHAIQTTRYSEMAHAFHYYKWHMVGTALCWFLLDVDFYANGLFNHKVTSMILVSSTASSSAGGVDALIESAKTDALISIVLSLIALPGYLLSVYYIEAVGRKNLQLTGFFVMGVLFLICAVGYDWLLGDTNNTGTVRYQSTNPDFWDMLASYGKYIFLIIYSMTFLFSNFGPNTTTFVIPGEIYPAEVRATCHGISAACGKLGAATGAYFFPILLTWSSSSSTSTISKRLLSHESVENTLLLGSAPSNVAEGNSEGMRYAMFACSFIAFLGCFVTIFFIPRYSGEMLAEEDNPYLPLEWSCLQPSDEDMDAFYEHQKKTNELLSTGGYEMMQVIHSAHDYAMEDFEAQEEFGEEEGDEGSEKGILPNNNHGTTAKYGSI